MQRELDGLAPGAIVTFTPFVSQEPAHAERVRVVRYESVEQDPLTARRLRLLQADDRRAVRRRCRWRQTRARLHA